MRRLDPQDRNPPRENRSPQGRGHGDPQGDGLTGLDDMFAPELPDTV